MNSVSELVPNPDQRGELIESLLSELESLALESGEPRWLLLVEPGSRAASRELLELRARLLGSGGERWQPWLPCLSARPCGALTNPSDWCHEEAACEFPEWMDALGESAGLRKESILFSHLILSAGPAASPADFPASGSRVVSQLLREKGLIQCYLCTERGKVRTRVLDSRRTDESAVLERAVRGTVYRSIELAEKGDVIRAESVGAQDVEPDLTVFPKPRHSRRS